MGIQSWLDKSKPEDYRNSKAGKAYENIGLPILAVLETIATQGKSPGTTALGQQDRLYNARRQFEQDQQTAKEKALQEKVQQGQLDEVTRKTNKENNQELIMNEYRKRLGIPGADADQEAEAYLRKADPQAYLTLQSNRGKASEASEYRKMAQEQRKAEADAKAAEKAAKKEEELAAAKSLKSEIYELTNEIENDPGFATGLSFARMRSSLPGTPEYAFKLKVDNLVNRLTLENRGKLKGQGQISDKESEMLQKASSMLNRGLDKTSFLTELNRIRNTVRPKEQGTGTTTTTTGDQYIVGQTYTDSDGNKATYLGNGNWKEIQ
jgi:hypothetical protein